MCNISQSLAEQGLIHKYKLGDYNIVLDIASGCIHSVDEITYDVICLYETAMDKGKNTASDYSRIITETLQKHPDSTEKDIQAIIVDIENLIHQGKLFTPDNIEALTEETRENLADTPLKALCLNVAHTCNMNCAYCFATPSFREENTLMTFETGKQAIDFLIENSGENEILDIDFFGGEPLLNWKVVKEIVAYADMAGKFSDKKFRYTLTTNGLLIDDDVIAFTNRHFYNVVLSLDGRPETHNKMRKTMTGEGSYEEVLPKIKKMVEARRGKGYYIRGTFTRENMDFSNDIIHLTELGFLEISLEPAVAKKGGKPGFTDNDLPELCKQYDTLAVEMRRRKENARYLRPSDVPPLEREFSFYHFNLDLENSPCIYKKLKGCGVGTQYLAVTPTGEIYPCHQFIGDKDYLLGDVTGGITNRTLQEKFASLNIFSRSECKTCWARYYCSGGCAANAYHATGKTDGIYKFGCELFKKRIENAIMLKL